jgi:hypothetical protein
MNIVDWIPFLASIVVVVLGYFFGKRKNDSDITVQTSEAVLKLIQPLNDRIDVQAARISILETTVNSQEEELVILRPLPQIVTIMTRGINILITQIRRQGCEPDWTPGDLEPIVLKLEEKLIKVNGKK